MSKSVPQLNPITTLVDTDLVHVVRSNIDYKMTAADLRTGLAAAGVFMSYMYSAGASAIIPYDISNADSDPTYDTLGGVWSYVSAGKCRYTKVGAFADLTKILAYTVPNYGAENHDTYATFTRIDDDVLELTFGTSSSFSSPSVSTPTNGVLSRLVVIQVWT